MAKCSTKRCTNERAKSRLFCHKCRKKKYKENNPVNNAYFILKYNAKRRGKEFSLTLEEFKQFCIETDYMSKKGRRSKSYTKHLLFFFLS